MNKIGWIRVFVSDMERAVDFYSSALGIPVRNRSDEFPDFVEMATEGAVLGLNRPADDRPDEKALIGRPTGITLIADDLHSVHSSLSAKGVRFSSPPTPMPWGALMTTVFDPDGNGIDLMQFPG